MCLCVCVCLCLCLSEATCSRLVDARTCIAVSPLLGIPLMQTKVVQYRPWHARCAAIVHSQRQPAAQPLQLIPRASCSQTTCSRLVDARTCIAVYPLLGIPLMQTKIVPWRPCRARCAAIVHSQRQPAAQPLQLIPRARRAIPGQLAPGRQSANQRTGRHRIQRTPLHPKAGLGRLSKGQSRWRRKTPARLCLRHQRVTSQ